MAEEQAASEKTHTGKISEKHATTLAKLSILFSDLATDIRIADTYEDVKKAVEITDKGMMELQTEFDDLEEVLRPQTTEEETKS